MSDARTSEPPVPRPSEVAASPSADERTETPGPVRGTPPVQEHLFWIIPCAVALLTLVAFIPTVRNGFVSWDDDKIFLENPHYRGLGWLQLRWMVTTFHMGHWVPLTWLTYALDYLVWGMNPAGYHLTNLLLHTAAATAWYFVALRLLRCASPGWGELPLRLGAGVAALFFAIHPLRVESVAWATERRDVLSGSLFLVTVLGYLKGAEAEGSLRRRWLAASVACYALALMAKAIVMTLPLTLLLIDVYPLGRLRWGDWRGPAARRIWVEKLPYLLLALAGAGMALYTQAFSGEFISSLEELPLRDRLAVAVWGLGFYPRKTLLPLGLSPLYELPASVNAFAPRYLLSALGVGVFTAGLLLVRRRWPAGLAAWIFYGITLAPVSGLAHTGPQLAADRYSYLSCLGWALLLGAAAGALVHAGGIGRLRPSWGYGAAVAGLAWGIALGALTWRQVQVWHDSKSLWSHALSVDTESLIAHGNLGDTLMSEGRFAEAIDQFREASRLRPTYAEPLFHLGNALLAQGRLDEGIAQFQEVLRLDPRHEGAAANIGMAMYYQGKVVAAIDYYRQVLLVHPEFAVVRNNLGAFLLAQGRIDEATDQFGEAMRLRPAYAEPYANMGRALIAQGRLDEAIGWLGKALELNPDLIQARRSLEVAMNRRQFLGEPPFSRKFSNHPESSR